MRILLTATLVGVLLHVIPTFGRVGNASVGSRVVHAPVAASQEARIATLADRIEPAYGRSGEFMRIELVRLDRTGPDGTPLRDQALLDPATGVLFPDRP
jgi:hypothetical protein